MVKTRAILRERDHQKTIGETGIAAKEEDFTTMTTMVLIVKWPQDTRTIIIKEMIAKTQDTAATTKKITTTIKDSNQGNLESTIHLQMIC
jgi:hypothetical protein